jgi:serine/threonine-protein kinase
VSVAPRPGAVREQGTLVTIVPSRGPPPVDVPLLKGELLGDAKASLAASGLRVDVARRYHPAVPADHVISRTPGGATLPEGTLVHLVISDGPRPVPLPDVRGKPEATATETLDQRGFAVVIEEDFSAKVGRGAVVRTDPGPGTKLQPGATIVLTVSLGPEYFPCPDLGGLGVDAARAIAERHGLELTALEVPGSGGSTIVSQIPAPGSRIRYGSTVTVYYA